MNRIPLGLAALLALGTSALAADLPPRTYTKAPDYVPSPVYNWTGLYLGGHLGGAFEADSFPGFTVSGNRTSFLGGGQVGADYQLSPNWLLGVEGQYSWVDLNRTATQAAVTVTDTTRGLGSVTGRLGYTWGPTLLYVKGGAGFRDGGGANATVGGVPTAVTANNATTGYTVGGGLEYMFTPSWSGKVEYQYYNFGNTNVTVAPATPTAINRDVNTVKFGLNYRFNWGGPVVAKY